MDNGTRVRIYEIFTEDETGFRRGNTKPVGETGVVVDWVRQYGGDVVVVKHDDGTTAWYLEDELVAI